MENDIDKQHKNKFDWLKAYQWQKGQSGNPAGRPKGRSMKEFMRDFLESMTDENKLLYLQKLTPEMLNAWKMGEGNPDTKQDMTIREKPIPIDVIQKDNSISEDKGTI